MASEAETVAAGLDCAEVSACKGRIVYMGSRVRDRLVSKGILTSRGGNDWTETGLAVRAILRKAP